jgi:hypothetical protein
MAKNIFYINAALSDKRKSILEVSADFIDLMFQLGEVDPVFLSPVYIRKDIKSSIKLIKGERENAVAGLANIILESHKSDILQHEKVGDPTIDFSRDFGFLLMFEFFKEERMAFSMMARLGASEYNELKIEFLMESPESDFNWYFSVLKGIVDSRAPVYGGVVIKLPAFFDPFKTLKVWPPLGWISYFSNDGAIKIPDDLKGVEYEHTDKGKFLILTREDFTTSKEVYETHRDKLLDIMKELKSRVPEYSEKK